MSDLTVAVIDLGSNSFRLQVSRVIEGTYKLVEEYKEIVRIGDVVFRYGIFTPEAADTILTTLKRMKTIIDNMKVSYIRAVGTAPFRDAKNSEEIIKLVEHELGITIDVISGQEEARLIYLASTGYFDSSVTDSLFVDIGGGSTELSFSKDGALADSFSTQLGCSRLTYEYVHKQKARPEEIQNMRKHINKEIAPYIKNRIVKRLIFTGGTANSIAQVYARRSGMVDSAVKYVDTVFLNHLVKELGGKNYEDRAKIPGIEADRADISLAAALIMQILSKHYEQEGFYTFSGGLRNGLTIDLLNKLGHQMLFQNNTVSDIRYSKLIETGRKYGFEEEHALHVTKLAKILFDNLYKELDLKETDWHILEAASVLHDIGQHISYSEHHKHSQYLIENTELVGYSEEDRLLVAAIARYHRRSKPKKQHEPYGLLTVKEQKRIYKLAALLRVADALDRSHVGLIQNLKFNITSERIALHVEHGADIGMEIKGVERKKDMLEVISKKAVTIENV